MRPYPRRRRRASAYLTTFVLLTLLFGIVATLALKGDALLTPLPTPSRTIDSSAAR